MQTFENQQPSLFDLVEEAPRVALTPALNAELAVLVKTLLAEIAAALAKEAGNEQDHQ